MTTETQFINKQRRKFLSMVSKAGISAALWRSSPFVGGAMVNRFAEAQGVEPKRFLALSYPAGAPQGSWMPSSITNMNESSEPYLGVAQYCNFHLVNVIGGGHGAAHAAMNVGSPDSFDVQLSRILSANTPYSAINLGIQTGSTSDLIGRIGGQGVRPEDNPQAALSQYFGGPPPGGAAEALYLKQNAILNANKDALNVLMKKLGSEEKERLETHLAAIERIDKRLNESSKFVPAPACINPEITGLNATDNGGGVQSEIKLMAEIAITAMSCGLSNVATIQLDDSQSEWRFTGSFSEGHHQTCHGRSRTDLIAITKYINEAAAYTIQKLADTPDSAGGGNMIDNTVFLQVTDQDGQTHITSGCPNILATNMPSFSKGTVGGGGTNQELMADVAEGLGLGGQIAAGNLSDIRKNAQQHV